MRSPKQKLRLCNKLFIPTAFSRSDKRSSNLQLQVGDEGLEAFGSYPLFPRLRPVLVKQLGAHTGAKLPLSQVVALLIERWDYMTPEEQGALIRLLD